MKKINENKYALPIIFLFVGILGTMLMYKFVPQNNSMQEVRNVNITTTNSIHESVQKVYNAVLVIEGYKYGSLVSSGTGFVYKVDDKYGYVITNHHVIENTNLIKITNNNKQNVEAKVIASDKYIDIAVLQIDKSAVIATATLGKSTDSKIGDDVFTVGAPVSIDYQGTVTKGILSNTKREVEVRLSSGGIFAMEVLQTDAAINPGNSGGPLLNIKGEVIGVISMKLVKETIEGMGFAIPIEVAVSAIQNLEKGKNIERPVLGVTVIDLKNNFILSKYDIKVDYNVKNGVVVLQVEKGYPAEVLGLQKGDIITKVNDDEVYSTAKFKMLLYRYNIGSNIKITYIRDGKTETKEVKLTKSA